LAKKIKKAVNCFPGEKKSVNNENHFFFQAGKKTFLPGWKKQRKLNIFKGLYKFKRSSIKWLMKRAAELAPGATNNMGMANSLLV
jgi:hypothetical protein